MVSVLQDQTSLPISPSGGLDGHRPRHKMHSHVDTGSPIKQENPGFCCQPYDGDPRLERARSESSQSSSPSSPPPDPLYRMFPAGPTLCPETDPYPLPSEKFGHYACEDGVPGGAPCGRFLKSSLRAPFHPYKRQLAEGPFPETPLTVEGLPFKAAGLTGYEEVAGEAEMYAGHFQDLSVEHGWCKTLRYDIPGGEPDPHAMDTEVKLKGNPLEEQPGLYCYQPQVPAMYCTSHTFPQQYPPGGNGYPITYLSASPYPYPRITPHGAREPQQPLFPKPIYSYSILIFMALKNSKTGSLPVSEIYNFMTEHFPYFKTAPDGWKNSVRHNLSLNKCFEKVENKSGSSSRKGCLWALNPAKIDKMQEELQKWKRKDPVAVRKSMAKPDELDTLIGDKTEKLKSSLMTCGSVRAGSPSVASRPMTLPHPPLYTPRRPRAQESSLAGHSPPRAPHGGGLMAPTLAEGDLSSDIDHLNPSLTDFDLQGNLWEELKDDSLAVDPMGLVASSAPAFPTPCEKDDHHDNRHTTTTSTTSSSRDLSPQHIPQPLPLPEIQLTTLYSAFMELDTGPAPYLTNPSSKPIALM